MSEVAKPVDETVTAPAVIDETPKTEETKVEEPVVPAETTTAPVEETPATTEEVAAAAEPVPAVAETPATFTGEGPLGYKAPGGNFLKNFASYKTLYFWLGEEAVDSKALASYIRGEKPEVANHNAAWASHTGKGLLFHSKHLADKATPSGVINLADVSELISKGTVDFVLISNGAKHTFQASTVGQRDAWVKALKEKSAEAKAAAESVKNSEQYKSTHSTLSTPAEATAVTAGAGPATKNTEIKKEEKAEAKEEKKEEKAEAKAEKEEEKEAKKEEKRTRKDRSASRKRNSIFGTFGLGKKEEKSEATSERATTSEDAAAVEPAAAEAAPLDAPAVATAVVSEPVVDGNTAAEPTRPAAAGKRNSSFFDTISSRFGQKKSTSEEAPAVPAKDNVAAEPISTEAPVIPEPETTEPLSTAVASPATVPVTEETIGAPATEDASETKAAAKNEKRKSSMPFGFGQKKEKSSTSDSEGEKKASPFAKLRQTVKSRSSPKAEKTPVVTEKAAEPAPATTELPASEVTKVENEPAVVSEPVPAATSTTPVVSATA